MASESYSQHNMFNFTLLSSSAPVMAPRLGHLAVTGRKAISTPHYLPVTTRGAVPHLTHDVMRDQTAISSLYVGLEDFIEKQPTKRPPPIYKVPTTAHESALRKFICVPEDILLIMGPRRVPPIVSPPANTPTAIAILTAVGFRHLESDEYTDAVRNLQPDIVVGLADLVVGHPPGVKRRTKMVDRTHAFTMEATEELYGNGKGIAEEDRCRAAYFAPILPLENTQQLLYLEELEDELRPFISGLALYEAASLAIVPESLGELPRVLFSAPATPQDILREVSLGADLLTIPFLGAASDAGMALHFTFPAPPQSQANEPQPLALDLWSPSYTTDTQPLQLNCECYTCQNHHRAYIKHLLSAKEMLAWSLLQIHNHHIIDLFFAGIRASIQANTFEEDIQTFERAYATKLPEKTGEGPRLRGYHLPPSGPFQPRFNPRKFGRLDDAAEKYAESAASSIATPDAGANELEDQGFAHKS